MKLRARPEKQQQVRGRRRARITMRILTSVCALAALGIGATELATNGLQAFVDRPAGVGASPSNDATSKAASPKATPSPAPNTGSQPGAQVVPNPDAPLAQPPIEFGPVDPGPRGEHPPPGFPRPDGARHRPGTRRGPPDV